MFGTPVIQRPLKSQGGEFVVTHQGRKHVCLAGGGEARSSLCWAAFYADCRHEVRAVTSGFRVTFVHSLLPFLDPPARARTWAPFAEGSVPKEMLFFISLGGIAKFTCQMKQQR